MIGDERFRRLAMVDLDGDGVVGVMPPVVGYRVVTSASFIYKCNVRKM